MSPRETRPEIIDPALTMDWLRANSTGKGVQVAVIDSGIDALHPVLQGKVTRACIVDDKGDGLVRCEEIPGAMSYDDADHGTGIAGIIAGIAPDADLISVKVLQRNNIGSGAALIAGLRWALKERIRLINMSVSTSERKFAPELRELCEQAYTEGAILVASRRNSGGPGYPAVFSSVISVDAEAFEDKYMIKRYPEGLADYGARGEDVEVARIDGAYGLISGASIATPHVTGIVALLLGIFPDLRNYQVKSILDSFARQRP